MVPGASVQSLRMSSKNIFLPSNFVAGIPAQHTKGYKGSRAMLKVNGIWIMSNLREHLLHASHEPFVRSCYNTRFEWQEGTFDMVYWESVRKVRNKMWLAQF